MGRTGRKLLLLLGAMSLLAIAMLTGAPAGAANSVEMQALLNDNGSGRLFVNNGTGGPWSWKTCSPDLLSCAPFGHGREITTAGARPETVFRASSKDGDTGLSPTWHGRVVEVDPPSVNGLIRVNELVKPSLARWGGGWKGDFDLTQLSACATPIGKRCTSLTDFKYVRGCKGGATVLDPQFAGDYLRVADRRYGAGTAFTMEAASSPYGHPIWRANGITAIAIVGQIGPPRSSERAECDSPLLIEASISNTGVATVRCELTCRAVMIVRLGSRIARVARDVPRFALRPPQGTAIRKLRLSARALAYLGRGRARFTLKVDGRQVAQRTVLLR